MFTAFEAIRGSAGLTIYLTADVKALPSYGPNVVAVVVSDESARHPDYAAFVRATFKCYGTDLMSGPGFMKNPTVLGLATSLNFARLSARRFPSVLKNRYRRARSASSLGPVFPIPLGYFRQAELPLAPILERRYDVYFRGSMAQRTTGSTMLSRLLQTPKTRSRSEMVAELRRIACRYPEHRIAVEQIPDFFSGSDDDALAFSEAMMQTKACVVPRGASFETFRYFEALRYGCVVIAEPMPHRWFYDGSPAFTLESWSQLESILIPILRDPERLLREHARSLSWWRSVCSESAVAEYMAAQLPY